MSIAPGTRLGPYEILSPLGAGGMGEVYRARDGRLGRDVAIKVLPQHLSANSEVRARFEREAKTVSSLNHPNICTLFDVGREGDTDYLVMELVEGETLAQRLSRGALPAPEVLKLGAQIADALDRAHRAGVIHRDLKPGNVMLTRTGAKLMDFGLARGVGLAGAPGSGVSITGLTQSPTIAQPLTAEGTIIGTFQYMAPEQLEGKEADTRSDIWALGCVLYEMATGTRAFEGKSQASLIATIMHTDPRPLRELAPATPESLDRLIRECLAKDPEERRQSAGDVRRELGKIARGDDTVATAAPAAKSAMTRTIVIAAVAAVAAAFGSFFVSHRGEKKSTAPEQIAFTIPAPPGSRFRFTIDEDGTRLAPPCISPDGRQIVFGVVDASGQRMLVRRSLDELAVHTITGSVEGRIPFWSPDNRTVGFFSDGKLRKVSIAGGSPVTVADGAPNARGAAWSARGVILYTPSANSGLYKVSADGGVPEQVTFPDTTLPDISHRWPIFMPDGEQFVFLVWTNNAAVRDSVGGLYLGNLSSHDVKRIAPASSSAAYVDGSLIFARDGALVIAPFDLARASLGELKPTDQRVGWDPGTGGALFTLSSNGTLLCRENAALGQARLVWFDRFGAPGDTISGPANFRAINIARNGNGAAVCAGNTMGDGDIWLLDFNRRLMSRFTTGTADEQDPRISMDGRNIAYTSDVDGPYHVFTAPADRSFPPQKHALPADDWNLLDWSPDGKLMLMSTSTHLWLVDVATRHVEPLRPVSGSFASSAGSFSPDSRWITYWSSDSGRDEIYVGPSTAGGGQWQVSTNGGLRPHWSNDGREIVYTNLDGDLLSARVDTQNGFRTEAPRRLFRIGPNAVWAASGDHTRFLVAVRAASVIDPPLKVVTHWLSPAR